MHVYGNHHIQIPETQHPPLYCFSFPCCAEAASLFCAGGASPGTWRWREQVTAVISFYGFSRYIPAGTRLPLTVHEMFLKLFRTDSREFEAVPLQACHPCLQRRRVRVDLSSFIHTKCHCPVLHATYSSQLPLPYPLSCHPCLLRHQKLHHAAMHTSTSDSPRFSYGAIEGWRKRASSETSNPFIW